MGSPEFDNKSDKLIKLFWIGNNGQEKWMCDLHPGAHRPPSSWHAYPRVGCWVAKEGDKELLRVSSSSLSALHCASDCARISYVTCSILGSHNSWP